MKLQQSPQRYDYIIIGGGLAGLYCAYFLAQHGSVALIARRTIEESNSYYAQGGMAAVTDQQDSPTDHYEDTIVAGRGLCIPEAVKVLTDEAPDRINELIQMGMTFDSEDGHLALGLEGGHHHRRILHAGGDATGRLVTTFMIEQVRKAQHITIFDHHSAVQVLRSADGSHCQGIVTYDERAHHYDTIFASAVVLATGGAAALYYPTTNPPTALGDGLWLASEVGAELMDLEFIQFHPTALYLPGYASFLISEAVRGEGAYLVDKHGERFMPALHPLAELAPRDVVARSIFLKMQEEGSDHVRLRLRHIDPKRLLQRFPTITEHCRQLGLDITDEIPVAPAAHYTVGGIGVDLNGCTRLPGLYAVGEVSSTGVMGANRLASNSLIECIVFGKRIANYAIAHQTTPTEAAALATPTNLPDLSWSLDKEQLYALEQQAKINRQIGDILMSKVGIIRSKAGLTEALQALQHLSDMLAEDAQHSIHAYMTRRRVEVAHMMAHAALLREESRGGHYRSDYIETLPESEAYRTRLLNGQITHQPIN